MATEIKKTYSTEVEYTYNDGREIADADLHVAELRTIIKHKIAEQICWQKGNLNSNPTQDTQEA